MHLKCRLQNVDHFIQVSVYQEPQFFADENTFSLRYSTDIRTSVLGGLTFRDILRHIYASPGFSINAKDGQLNPYTMGLLPDTQNCGLRMRRECFPHQRPQRKPQVSDPGMHHGTCVTHAPWCMSGSPTRGGGEKFSAIPAHAQPPILCIW